LADIDGVGEKTGGSGVGRQKLDMRWFWLKWLLEVLLRLLLIDAQVAL